MSDNFLSEEDKALFRVAMKTVKPLQKKISIDLPTPTFITPEKTKMLSSQPLQKTSCYLSDNFSDEVQAETMLSYRSPELPQKRLHALKKGKIPYESRLDLHGLKQQAAKECFLKFVEKEQYLGRRCLLIIHGKGSLKGEAPILKNLINSWLRQHPLVLAFHSAKPCDGGNGALYVLLKKAVIRR